MLKLAKRLLTSALAGFALQPNIYGAKFVPIQGREIQDADSEAKHIAQHPMQAVGVRPEYLAMYEGPRTVMTPEVLAKMQKSRFRNYCFDGNSAADEFIRERTK